MTSDYVFLAGDDGSRLRRLPARPFRLGLHGQTLEDALKGLIERHPDVLPGHEMDPGSTDPPRFVLLRREMPIGSWAVDHLLADQRGVPTLVEAKLLQNREARRAVIGQILEYAATAAASWVGSTVQEQAAEYWQQQGRTLAEVLCARFGGDFDVDNFWAALHDNLQRGRFRLIIVADELHPEVRRIIEYLNLEMRTAEVYGVELSCYADDASTFVLVPRLVGRTQDAADRKSLMDTPTLWTSDRLRGAYAELPESELRRHLGAVLEWSIKNRFFAAARAKNPTLSIPGRSGRKIFTIYPDGAVYWVMNDAAYLGGAAERDALANLFASLAMLGSSLAPNQVVDGRNLARKIGDLSRQEFDRFLEGLAPFCGLIASTTLTTG